MLSQPAVYYAAAVVLVLIRCVPSVWFEQFDFNSDQAVVGLMAKHLVERRNFPLFFYGQNYMLGVQAWIAAPFFVIGGPTVAMLRAPLLLINVSVVFWLMIRLVRKGIHPALALVATLPLIAPGPLASTLLMQTLGASIEPFLWILLLWAVRRHPSAFGTLFAAGYLHREFVLFALPALLVVWWVERGSLDREAVTYALKAATAFAVIWIGVDQIARHVNTLGPPGGEYAPGSLVAQSEMVVMRLAWDRHAYLERLIALFRGTLPDLFALRSEPSWLIGVNSQRTLGSALGGVAFLTGNVLAATAVLRTRTAGTVRSDRFPLYLGLIAAQTVLAYALNGGLNPATPGVARYVLFALLMPIAVLCGFVERRPSLAMATAVGVLVTIWAGQNVRDSVGLVAEYVTTPPPNERRALVDYLTSHRIRYGRADYWDAYLVDFLSRERVILAPVAVMRISSYDARVAQNSANAVTVSSQPCVTGERVASWCVEDPLHR